MTRQEKVYAIVYMREAAKLLSSKALAKVRSGIMQAVADQLSFEPMTVGHGRKLLKRPPGVTDDDTWQLTVGEWRVHYDVKRDEVRILDVFHKAPHTTTEAAKGKRR